MVHLADEQGSYVASPTIFDPAVLTRLGRELGDGRVALRVAQRFVEALPMRVRSLDVALEDSDAERALDVALTIKVTAATVGARELQRAAGEVEACVRVSDWSGALDRVPAVHRASAPLRRELRSYLGAQAT